MKQTFLTLAALACAFSAGAQVIDRVQYRVTYKTQFVEDTTKKATPDGRYAYKDDEMCLDVGDSISRFYSARTYARWKWMDDAIKHGGEADVSKAPPAPELRDVFWCNYPQGMAQEFPAGNGLGRFRIEEPLETPQWELSSDTCTLLGYHCTTAVTDFRGRHWTAWYAEDIPLDQGPWLLGGLPGLILKAEDAREQWRFTAIGLEQPAGKDPINLSKDWKKFDPITRKKFYKLRRTVTRDDLFKQRQARDPDAHFVAVNPDGTPMNEEQYNEVYKKVDPFNPIDLSE